MIYDCLHSLREWLSPLTAINFILLGGASCFTMATLYADMFATTQTNFSEGWTIGSKHPRIAQTEQGEMGGSFDTRKFFHGKSEAFLSTMKTVFLVLAFVAPVLLLIVNLSYHSIFLLGVGLVAQYFGSLAERWYFFAEAYHPQNLYYQWVS
jgi:DMSO reductase anchor subunit